MKLHGEATKKQVRKSLRKLHSILVDLEGSIWSSRVAHLLAILRFVFNMPGVKNAQSALVFIALLYCTVVLDSIKMYQELGTETEKCMKHHPGLKGIKTTK